MKATLSCSIMAKKTYPAVPASKLPIPELDEIFDRADVNNVCEHLTSGYRDRVANWRLYGDSRSNLSPTAWLRQMAYIAINVALSDDWYEFLENRIDRYDRRRRGVEGEPNIFQTGLLGIFAHDPEALSSAQRVRLGRHLWYAYYHFVPPPFLEAFLKGVGTQRIMELAPQNVIDDGYKDWIISQAGDIHSYNLKYGRATYSYNLLALVGYREADDDDDGFN